VELAPRASWIQTERGNVLARLYRPSEAETAYRAAIELDPLCLSARAGLARMLEDADRLDESLETWRAVLRNRPIDPEALLGQARVLERKGEIDAALRSYGNAFQVSRVSRNRIALLEELAEALDRLGQPLSVLQLLTEISGSRPDDAALHLRIADLHLELGQMDLALERLDTLLARDPESVEALIKKARFLSLAGRADEAETEIEKALALDSTDSDALVVKGILASGKGDATGALALFEKATRTDRTGEAYNQMAWLLLTGENAEGDPARAVELSRKAVEANPVQPEFVDTLARALSRSGDVEGATGVCTSFLEQHPKTATLLLTLADLQDDAGNASQAAASYRSAAEVYRDQGRLKRAVEVMDQALSARPDDADLLAMREQLEKDRQARQDERSRPAAAKAPGKGAKKKGGKKGQGETAN
jgi:tetratricopeptide (TPR) repeat protein